MPEIDINDLEHYKAEHLLLLIGGNTLPNAVTASRLVKAGGVVTMLCTEGTKEIGADYLLPYLEQKLAGQGVRVGVFQELMDESRQSSICTVVSNALALHPGKRAGLHYTTGTKAMAVHAHRVVSNWAPNKGKPLLSYLSARNLRLYFDMEDPSSGNEEDYIDMQADQVSLAGMLGLHGGKFKNGRPQETVFLPKTAVELARISKAGGPQLHAWLDFKDGRYAGQRFKSEKNSKGIADHLKAAKPGLRSDDPRYLSELEANLAAYQPVDLSGLSVDLRDVLRTELPFNVNHLDLVASKPVGSVGFINTFYEWICGKWLEHYTLHCLKQANKNGGFGMHDMCINIEPTYPNFKDIKFELDVLGIRGYQLFGFSCAIEREINEGEGRAKWKLFEAIMRARQIGGDEARVAFVCLLRRADCLNLEKEASNILSEKSKIRVFGIDHLLGLHDHIKNWIKTVEEEGKTA